MITTEQWRIAIGSFKHIKFNKQWRDDSMSTRVATAFLLVLFVMLFLCDLNIGLIVLLKLITAGDVEMNPGPTYNIVKLVKASFHQGNPMFDVSTGIQCACNALFAICWAKIKNMSYWTSCDLDYILIKTDELFESISLFRYLAPEDLPNELNVEGTNVAIEYVRLVTVEIFKNQINFIQPSFLQFGDKSNGIIFFVSQTPFSLLWNKKYFFLFDSHSRDEQGKVSPHGTGILLKFTTLSQVRKYILENYLVDRESIFCQIQYIKAEIDSNQNPVTQAGKKICL